MSLVETIVSMGLTVALSGTILSLVVAGQTIARNQPEAADLQQRARVAVRTIGAELRDAGAGIERGVAPGPLIAQFPPIAPSADGGITIWRATSRDAQGSPALLVATGATTIALQDGVVCPAGQAACGFQAGASAIAFNTAGCRTTVRVAAVDASALQLAAPLAGCALDPASSVAAGEVHTYRVDPVARQLVRRDEVTGSSAPLLDGVAGFSLALFADAAATQPIPGSTDLDLMRVRLVRVTLRFTTSNPLLRIPDLTVTFDTVPRNMAGGS